MELAAIAALRGNADEAARWLNQGYKAGWRFYRGWRGTRCCRRCTPIRDLSRSSR